MYHTMYLQVVRSKTVHLKNNTNSPILARELQHRKRPRSSQNEDIDTAIIEGFRESREMWDAADVDPSVCDTPAAVGRSTSHVTPSPPSTSLRPPRPSPRELQHRKRP